ncbi:hypothetical protein [Anaerotardibacter muris]|uniref:hypothetical protein n=1 Tax=Anaerotardibacter muris TaxID=2941505 RepID=UPI00203EE7F1|nr:hypothetical protein [Anaerotardibacter muris]
MASHSFSFDGGDILNNMGATWFVSYAYYDHLDKTHMNWNRISTTKMRINNYNRSENFHKSWLEHVLRMNDKNLKRNTISLSPSETKRMAKELLERAF